MFAVGASFTAVTVNDTESVALENAVVPPLALVSATLPAEPDVRSQARIVNAVSDGVLAAYIPLLEVLPGYQDHGIGSELVRRMLETLSGLYMVDLLCDAELQPFYTRFGMRPATGMFVRNYSAQSGSAR